MKAVSGSKFGLEAVAYVGLWIALALAVGGITGSMNLRRYYALESDGIRTTGTVTALEPENHQVVRYRYQVAGATYEGVGSVGVGNPGFNALDVGTSVMIYYERPNPRVSALGDPAPRLHNEIESVTLASFLVPTILVGAIAFRRTFRR